MVSNRKEVTRLLSEQLEHHLNPHNDSRIYWAKEVTFDYSTTNPIRVDYMQFKPVNNTVSGIEKGDFYCFEVKSSVDDFHSKNGHNMIGDYNYYVMPRDVFEAVKDEIPWDVGVYGLTFEQEFCEQQHFPNSFQCLKKARRKDRTRPVSEMLLMMFRSANRENIKLLKERDSNAYST